MQKTSRMPDLALPFGLVGLAAGWLSAGLLINPLVSLTLPGKQGLSAICAGLVAAALGACLSRRCAPNEAWAAQGGRLAPSATRVRVVFGVLAAGAAAGLSVGAIAAAPGREGYGAFTGALQGMLCSTAFLPVCALVVSTAQRAARARLGSLVAASDRRSIVAILASALAVTTLLGVIDWPASLGGYLPPPFGAVGIALGAGLALSTVMVCDAIALRRVARITALSQEMELRTASPPERSEGASSLDLGLGHDVHARVVREGSAYRGRERAVALVLGSPLHARTALRRALARGLLGLTLVIGVLAAHKVAAGARGVAAYHGYRCDRGVLESCRAREAVERYRGGCEAGDPHGCDGLRLLLDQRTSALRIDEIMCERGSLSGCLVALAAAASRSDGDRVARLERRAFALGLRTPPEHACAAGSAYACCDAAYAWRSGGAVGRDPDRASALAARAAQLGATVTATGCGVPHRR
jgi:hypothetical protein